VAELWVPLIEDGVNDSHPLVEKRDRTGLMVGLNGARYSYYLEVGRGTIEVITCPCEDLHVLRNDYEEAMVRLVRAADSLGARVLGYGIQPATTATPAFMSPKTRYEVLLKVIGPDWLTYALTASDQVHVDIARDEVIAVTNLGNLLTPISIALCANSPVVEGGNGAACSAREHRMGVIGSDVGRHGMLREPFSDLAEFVERLSGMSFLWRNVDGVPMPYEGTFLDHLAERGGAQAPGVFEDWLLHEHYLWYSARPRGAYGTVELRSACQQPAAEHMAATALALSMVEAAPALAAFTRDLLGDKVWPLMRAWHNQVVLAGLAAPEPNPGLLDGVLERCETALSARGRGEEQYLLPLRRRLEARENPAQAARRVFAEGGMAALVEHTAWPRVP
jgi:gamma-glutamylcysteine synthetase